MSYQTAESVLDSLGREGIQLWVEDDELRYRAPAGALTRELRSAVAATREELKALVQRTGYSAAAPEVEDSQSVWLPTSAQAAFANVITTLSDLILWRGPVDPGACEDALNEIVRRHGSLRTHFKTAADGRLWAVTEPTRRISVDLVDLSHLAPPERDRLARRIARERVKERFDLQHGPLLRLTFIKLAPELNASVFVVHHSVFDERSRGVFLRELSTFYNAKRSGVVAALDPPSMQFDEYARAENEWLESAEAYEHLLYWREKLSGAKRPFWLPHDRSSPPPQDADFRAAAGHTSAVTTLALRDLAKQEVSTLFSVALAALSVLLSRWSGLADTFVWIMHSQRMRPELLDSIGLYIDAWPFRVQLPEEMSFRSALRSVMRTYSEATPHLRIPPSRLGPLLMRTAGAQIAPATVLSFVPTASAQPEPFGSGISAQPLDWAPQPGRLEARGPFALNVQIRDTGAEIYWIVLHDPSLFEDATIQEVSRCLARLLDAVAANPESRLKDLPVPYGA